MAIEKVQELVMFDASFYAMQQQTKMIYLLQDGNITNEQFSKFQKENKRIYNRLETAEKYINEINKHGGPRLVMVGQYVSQLFNEEITGDQFADSIRTCHTSLKKEQRERFAGSHDGQGISLSSDKLVQRKKYMFPDFEIELTMKSHSIPYKDQLWPVDARNIMYKVALVRIKGAAANIANEIYRGSDDIEEVVKSVYDGRTTFYKIFTEEPIPNGGEIAGYVELRVTGNKLQKRTVISNDALRIAYLDSNQIEKEVARGIRAAKALG